MKAILEFNLPEEQEEFKLAENGSKYHSMLWEVRQKILRPARKHGYKNQKIQDLLEKIGENGYKLIELLEQEFNEITDSVDV